MREFTKKEIQGIVENLSQDKTRPSLCAIYLDTENKKLVATDGYTMLVVNADWSKNIKEQDGFHWYIKPEVIKNWLKLVSAKATITADELVDMATEEMMAYPDYAQLFDKFEKDTETSSMLVDYSLMKRLDKVMGDAKIEFRGKAFNTMALVVDEKTGDKALVCGINK